MSKNTKLGLSLSLLKVSETEWKFKKAATKAWTLREASRLSKLPISTVHRVLRNFYRKGQLKFLVDLRKANLLPLIAVFPKLKIKVAPPFTRAVRVVYNMGSYILVSALIPPPFVKKYLSYFDTEPLFVVKGYEYTVWSPLSPLTEYCPETKSLLPVFNFEPIVKLYDYSVKPWGNSYRAPDIYDLVLLQGRMRNPFARPLAIYEETRRNFDPSLPAVSEQVLSYHFNKHVKAMWKGNTALIYADTRIIPIRIYYFEGRDAPLYARLLCQLPGAFSATIDVNKAVVIAQFPCYYDEHIMCEAEYFEVEMPYGYFVQSSINIARIIPKYWQYIENKKWMFKEKLAIPLKSIIKTVT